MAAHSHPDRIIAFCDDLDGFAVAEGVKAGQEPSQREVKNYQVQYVIRSLSEGDEELDGAAGAFWSNADGWGCLQTATHFTTSERMSFHLPLSAKMDAEWMLLEEAVDLVNTAEQAAA